MVRSAEKRQWEGSEGVISAEYLPPKPQAGTVCS
jgi:hypothetical protein